MPSFKKISSKLARKVAALRPPGPPPAGLAAYSGGRGWHAYRQVGPGGQFDYERYKSAQTEANRRKIDGLFARKENIDFIAEFIRSRLGTPRFGLCHGTRRGLEQAWFSEALGCETLGTEISDTAGQFPNTIQWDFHDVKPEWLGAVDFIYSNSFDHSYDPEKCLNAWMSCLRPGGLCILEHSPVHSSRVEVSGSDLFGADLEIMPYLILGWGKGRYAVTEMLDLPEKKKHYAYLKALVVENLDSARRRPH